MIRVFKPEQYGRLTFGVALFELDAQSWYCGALLPRRIRKDYDFGTDDIGARLCAQRQSASDWRYVLRDVDGEAIGGTDSADDAIDFARSIIDTRHKIGTDDLRRRFAKIRLHDRDENGRCFYEATAP